MKKEKGKAPVGENIIIVQMYLYIYITCHYKLVLNAGKSPFINVNINKIPVNAVKSFTTMSHYILIVEEGREDGFLEDSTMYTKKYKAHSTVFH